MRSLSLVLLSRNPGSFWQHWLSAVQAQQPAVRVLVVDSASTDGTDFSDLPSDWQLLRIAAENFNHGGTRNFALQHLPVGNDVVVFMTQDAILANAQALQKLVAALDDPAVACAWGRQLPHIDEGLVASPIAAHARVFNYPAISRTVSLADKWQFGLKTCFPSDVILGEDMAVAAKLLMAGKRVTYVAEACVYHSHNYTTLQEFRRYFDTGVFHARNPCLFQTFGGAGGEGLRFVKSEIAYLLKHAPGLLPLAAVRTLAKWGGYKLGWFEAHLPLLLKRWCSMHKGYWDR
jgi:rhamnosyltransferase